MCTNLIHIPNKYRLSKIGNYFACGRCPACKQAAANRRANKIRHHDPQGFTSYFVTLSYRNDCIPYILKDDYVRCISNLDYAQGHDQDLKDVYETIDIYRDSQLTRDKSRSLVKSPNTIIKENYVLDKLPYNTEYTLLELQKLCGIRKKVFNPRKREYEIKIADPNKISVCYPADTKDFFKRLRTNLYRHYGKNIPLSYFHAPEYGPTTQRFHIHLLIWFPSEFTETEVRRHICEAWPYGDKGLTAQNVEIARNPSNYVASYVNCSADVSSFLLTSFPLRPSHSLHFGFDENVFSFQAVMENFKRDEFRYVANIPDSNGVPCEHHIYYPKYVINRYFPMPKGHNRINRDTLMDALIYPQEYFRTYAFAIPSSFNVEGQPLFRTHIVDVYGDFITMTKSEMNGTINRINRAYETYFAPHGYNRLEFADLVVSYHTRRKLHQYQLSQTESTTLDSITNFINLCDLYEFRLDNETVEWYLDALDKDELYPNTQSKTISRDNQLLKKYETNIKKRKVNNLYSP